MSERIDAVCGWIGAAARVVIVNAEPTPFDELADAVLPGSLGAILPRLCSGLVPA